MKRYYLSHQKNIRDLGGTKTIDGKTIKYGRLYRGGVLNKVNEEDINVLNSFHLTDIVDFRSEDEYKYNPDYELDGVIYHNSPAIEERVNVKDRKKDDGNLLWFVTDNTSGFEHLKRQYVDLINTKKGQEAYQNFFKVLLKEDKVIYFHCSQGKDRAGLGAFFILTALNVDKETIINDYLESNIAMDEKIDRLIKQVENKPFYNEEYKKSLIDVFHAKIEYLNAAIEEMNRIAGSPIDYIKNILNVDIDRLRKIYLK